ncbi:unnamed protein product [Rotaria sp. Silwood2]|nr:unnamed protein product [Rotaria sp. Silwood2]CAF4329830.1 unnamed protein product [Rotaria sp. Silwood2]
MLSSEEYQETKRQLRNITSTGKLRQTLRRSLLHKLKEHDYATKFTPFEPLPHTRFFINRITTEPVFDQIIKAATTSNEFTIDTESVNVYKSRNEPALIQVQIILPHDYSIAVLIETHHLPSDDDVTFLLFKKLFQILFSPDKIIYIWGSRRELIPFTQFGLFSEEQVNHIKSINLQNQFKIFWKQQHPHQPSSTTTNNCLCETCLGKNPGNSWSLQDAVAHELKEYLSKQSTLENFNIGLDLNLFDMNEKKKQYREQLVTYALHDCFSMHKILINMKNKNFNFSLEITIKIPYDMMESISSSDDEIMFSQLTPPIERLKNDQILNINQETQLISSPTYQNSNWKISSTNDSKSANQRQIQATPSQPDLAHTQHSQSTHDQELQHKTQQLPAEQRKRIHNRSCTLKQRRRYYQSEIIIKNIDKRFTIREIKDILKYQNVSFYAVNTSISSRTNERTLYIGIRDITKLSLYEHEIKQLFTSSYFRQFQRMKRLISHPHHKFNQNVHQHHHHI